MTSCNFVATPFSLPVTLNAPIIALANYILNSQLHVMKYTQYQFEEYLSLCRLYFMEANEGFCWLTIVYIAQTYRYLLHVAGISCFIHYDAELPSFFHCFRNVLQHKVR